MFRSRLLALLAICVSLLLAPASAFGADETYWQGDPATPGDWLDPANWTNGLPDYTGGIIAYVENGRIAAIGAGIASADGLRVGESEGGAVIQSAGSLLETRYVHLGAPSGHSASYEMNGGQIDLLSGVGWLSVCGEGSNIFLQGGGVLSGSQLRLGGYFGPGTYELVSGEASFVNGVLVEDQSVFRQMGGNFSSPSTSLARTFEVREGGTLEIGGTASFIAAKLRIYNGLTGGGTQSGGTAQITVMNVGASLFGSYLLEGGDLATSYLSIGPSNGQGTFRQTGGIHTAGNISLAPNSYSTREPPVAIYEMVGGRLEAEEIEPSRYGTCNFDQTGGTVTVQKFLWGYGQTYSYTGGTLEITHRMDSSGTMDFGGSAVTLTGSGHAWFDLTRATFANASQATLETGPNTVTVISDGMDLNSIFGTVNTQGMVHTAGQTFFIPSGKTVITDGELDDHVVCEGVLLHSDDRSLSLRNGLEVNGGTVELRYGDLLIKDSVSGISEGQLTAADTKIYDGGRFLQSGGSMTASVFAGIQNASGGTFEMTGGHLTAGWLSTEQEQTGRIVQRGGSIVSTTFGGRGLCDLLGGTLASNTISVAGNGVVHQEGSSVSARVLNLEYYSTYELVSGGLTVSDDVTIRGQLHQTGSTCTVADTLQISTSTGAYELSGGQLSASVEYVDQGLLRQTGGANTVESLVVDSSGHYELTAGMLCVGTSMVLKNELALADGNAVLLFADGTLGDFSQGTILGGANASIIAGVNTNMFFPQGFNPYTDLGYYDCLGETHLFGDIYEIQAGQTAYLGGDFTSHVVCAGTLNPAPDHAGVNLLQGLEISGDGQVDLGTGSLSVDDEVSGLTGGKLTAQTMYVGKSGTGRCVQSGGSVRITGDPDYPYYEALILGHDEGATGSYELSGSGVLETSRTYIGFRGQGYFTQSGGTHITQDLHVSWLNGSVGSGSYELSDGNLVVRAETNVGNGYRAGHFVHTGGRFSTGKLFLYGPLSEQSSYDLGGTGVLETGTSHVRAGTVFAQSGGSHEVQGRLSVGGIYNLWKGTLSAGTEYIDGGNEVAVFRQSGGMNSAAQITVGVNGKYEYTGGTLQVGGIQVLGQMDFVGTAVSAEWDSMILDISQGSFANSQAASLNLGPHSLLIKSETMDMASLFADYSNAGVTHSAGSTLVIPAGKNIVGAGDITDFVDCYGSLQASVGGVISLSGGFLVHENGRLDVGSAEAEVNREGSGISGGEFLAGMLSVGSIDFMQSGGKVASDVVLQRGSTSRYELSGDGIIESDLIRLKYASSFTQTGGNIDVSRIIVQSSSYAAYGFMVSGGRLDADEIILGYEDYRGAMVQTAGAVTADSLYVGYGYLCSHWGASGTYELSGVGVLTTGRTTVGVSSSGDTGKFIQNGGVHTAGLLEIGVYRGASGGESVGEGYYELRSGQVDAGRLDIVATDSGDGPSGFLQIGGACNVTGDMNIASTDGRSFYDMRGGELDVGGALTLGRPNDHLNVPAQSELCISEGEARIGSLSVGPAAVGESAHLQILGTSAYLEVSESLILGPCARVQTIQPGATIHMTGSSFENTSTDPDALSGLGNLTLIFEGGPVDIDPFEVAGEDKGALMAGLQSNFALGGLEVGGAAEIGRLQLVDAFDNRPDWDGDEALYVHKLQVGAGAEMDLNGRNVYYLSSAIDAGATVTYGGGSLTAIAIPGAHAEVEGIPSGYSVEATMSQNLSAGYGTSGMVSNPAAPAVALSCTFELEQDSLAAALAASGEDYLTLRISYDEDELALLSVNELTLRPYWWDGSEWILGGTTTDGLMGESIFAGVGIDPTGYGIGYCGLNTDEDFMWVNINHASVYGSGGREVPEPATLSMLGVTCLLLIRRRRK